MKYFLDCDSMILYSVPSKFQHLIDEIDNGIDDEGEGTAKINKAKDDIIRLCKAKLVVDCLTQYL